MIRVTNSLNPDQGRHIVRPDLGPNFFQLFCCLLIFLKINFFEKFFSGIIRSELQTVWILIRPDILLGLIWVQTVCKSYQKTTLGGKELSLFT